MNCDACTKFGEKPYTGRFNAWCDGCSARALALSPDFHDSVQQSRRTERYQAALTAFFKDREEQGHQLVREWAKKLRQAKTGEPA